MRPLVPLVVLAMMLAGCSKDAPAATEAPAAVTVTSGDIRCSVVDAAVAPVAGARVRILALEQEATTDKNGECLFRDVPAGHHILDVSALGFLPAQAPAKVTGDDPVVRIQLVRDTSGLAYVNEYYWEGYIECGTNYFAVCGALHDNLGVTDDTYTTWFDTEADITHLQTELVWEDTQDLGDAFDMQHRYSTPEDHESGFYAGTLGRAKGPSPLVLKTDVKQYNAAEVGEQFEFVVAIFSGGASTVPQVGVTVGQSFEMFLHEFHGFVPPLGWQFSVHGTPAP